MAAPNPLPQTPLGNGGSRPVPDPTLLTTAYVREAVANLREIIETRLDGMDKAIKLLQDTTDRLPCMMNEKVEHLEALHKEKFESIQTQFLERDVRSDKTAEQTKCVERNAPILCADLVWRPAGELKVGDELIAFDQDASEPISNGISEGRRFRRALVTANSLAEDELVEVVTNRGSLKCNPRHPLLIHQNVSSGWTWVEAKDIKVGCEILSPVDVWQVEETWEAGWLSGMYDGEGWLNIAAEGPARLGIVQRASGTADEIRRVLEKRVTDFGVDHRIDHARWTDTVTFTIRRRPDVMRILGSIRPKRLLVHSDRTWEGRRFSSKRRKAVVLFVNKIGSGTVASLSTSTGTYIAGGFASHNTAVDAALQAAEKAVNKQNESSTASIDKSEKGVIKLLDGLDGKISDVKDRVTRIEGLGIGKINAETKQEAKSTSNQGIIGLIIAAIVGAAGIIIAIVLRSP